VRPPELAAASNSIFAGKKLLKINVTGDAGYMF
jgi:hypothetical protein